MEMTEHYYILETKQGIWSHGFFLQRFKANISMPDLLLQQIKEERLDKFLAVELEGRKGDVTQSARAPPACSDFKGRNFDVVADKTVLSPSYLSSFFGTEK